MTMFSAQFIKDAVERAVKTAAQSALGVFVADVTVVSVDWAATGAIVGTATLVSVLTSIASANFGTPGTASAVTTPEQPTA
ncbi:hypothetical protein SEA_ODAY_29 [Gordonia phage ODay]|nr:hypothetical protein SEA_ODAY_29 [Gordonia phage ODay]